jgi:flagellar biogenesis protein FliO
MPRVVLLAIAWLAIGLPVDASDRTRSIDQTPPVTQPDRHSRSFPVQIVRREDSSGPSTSSDFGRPIPLKPPSEREEAERSSPATRSTGSLLSMVLSSLAIVLGLFFAVVWLTRRSLPKASQPLPSEAFEVLGKAPLTARQTVQLIRFGQRLLLLSVTTDGARTLAEISDTQEVEHLSGLCQQSQPASITASFRQVLHQLGNQSPGRESGPETASQGV